MRVISARRERRGDGVANGDVSIARQRAKPIEHAGVAHGREMLDGGSTHLPGVVAQRAKVALPRLGVSRSMQHAGDHCANAPYGVIEQRSEPRVYNLDTGVAERPCCVGLNTPVARAK